MSKDTAEFVHQEPRDEVNHPPHYNCGDWEVIDVIEAAGLGFHLGNVLKYVMRAGHKNPYTYTQDLKKAAWYLERAIARAEDDLVNIVKDNLSKKGESVNAKVKG